MDNAKSYRRLPTARKKERKNQTQNKLQQEKPNRERERERDTESILQCMAQEMWCHWNEHTQQYLACIHNLNFSNWQRDRYRTCTESLASNLRQTMPYAENLEHAQKTLLQRKCHKHSQKTFFFFLQKVAIQGIRRKKKTNNVVLQKKPRKHSHKTFC